MTHLWTSPEIADPGFYHHDLLRQLEHSFDARPRTDHVQGVKGVHVLMVLARWLFENKTWFKSLRGPKIVVEHDGYANFLPESPYHRQWTKLYRDCHFNVICSSGKETTRRLREEGLPAVWVPKGTNAEFLEVPNQRTGKLGYFSCPIAEQETGREFHFYDSRRAMGKALKSLVEPVSCPFREFVPTLSGFSGVFTNDATMSEPMAKQFECSALGVAVIRDLQPELYDLGYVEGESVISYSSMDELKDLVTLYKNNPELLIKLGENARLASRHNTWADRAASVKKLADYYSANNKIFI